MYNLEDGSTWTETIKNAFKRNLTRAYIKYGNTILDQSNYLMNAKYKDEKADPDNGNFIGITSMRELTIKLNNENNQFNLENEDIEYHLGAKVGNEYKYINFGNFIVQKPDNEEVNEEMTFTALDYMCKFDTDEPYEPQVVFPTTLLGITQDICNQAGVILGNTDFRNASMQILANPFTNGENKRTVLKSIAKLSFSCAYIGQDNKLYIGFNNDISTVTENITTDGYFENKPNDIVKPITAITLRSSEIKTVGQTIYDEEHIVEYGTNELIIEEDYLAYTDELRLAYLQAARALFGLTYKPLTIDVLGSAYLSFNDVIQVTNPQNEVYKTYALNNNHEYNGTLYNTISVPSLSEVEEQYKYESYDATNRRKTAVEIDKANQKIVIIEEDIGDRSQKTSSITDELDQIELVISDLEDLTLDVTGINPLQLDNCLEGELIRLNIKGNNTVFSRLYPNNNLYPSNNLYPMGDSFIKVYTDNICDDNISNWYIYQNSIGIEYEKRIFLKERAIYVSIENPNYKISIIRGWSSYGSGQSPVVIIPSEEEETEIYIDWDIESPYKYIVSFDIMIERKDGENVSLSELADIKPMVTYSNEKLEYVKYNSYEIDLGIKEPLRQYSAEVYDELIYDSEYLYNSNTEDDQGKNKVYIIRRVGVDPNGDLYALVNPTYEILDIPNIMLVTGTNYIDIGTGYTANMSATWVQVSEFTKVFATQYQITSQILQLANAIQLLVSEKVGNDEVIAKINLAVEDEQGIINIKSNQLTIDSDKFKLSADGTIISTAGVIAGWNIGNDRLYKNRSGIMSSTTDKGLVFYAGAKNGETQGAKFYVLNNGEVTMHFLHIEADAVGDTGIHIYSAGENDVKMLYDARGILFRDNGADFVRLGKGYSNNEAVALAYWLYNNAEDFEIIDSVKNQILFYISKNNSSIFYLNDSMTKFYIYDRVTSCTLFNVDNNNEISFTLTTQAPDFRIYYSSDNINFHTAFQVHNDGSNQATITIQSKLVSNGNSNLIKNIGADDSQAITQLSAGSSAMTITLRNGITYQDNYSTSDKRLKKNIKETEIENAIELINKIKHYSFDWKDNDKHQKIGYIANELYEIDDCLADKIQQGKNAKYDELYQFNTNNLLALCTKAIQELSSENKELKEKINKLEEKINKLEENK